MSCIDSIDIYTIDGMTEKPWVSAFQNFLRIKKSIENWESYGQECVDVFCIDSVNIDSIECIRNTYA